MMKKFIHKELGTDMWISEERIEEYKTAGHIPADDITTEEEQTAESEEEQTTESEETSTKKKTKNSTKK